MRWFLGLLSALCSDRRLAEAAQRNAAAADRLDATVREVLRR